MSTTTDTVYGRIELARFELTPIQLALGISIVAAIGFGLFFVQEPMVHDSLHNFRHTMGITCH